jgi:hypothetical protein
MPSTPAAAPAIVTPVPAAAAGGFKFNLPTSEVNEENERHLAKIKVASKTLKVFPLPGRVTEAHMRAAFNSPDSAIVEVQLQPVRDLVLDCLLSLVSTVLRFAGRELGEEHRVRDVRRRRRCESGARPPSLLFIHSC